MFKDLTWKLALEISDATASPSQKLILKQGDDKGLINSNKEPDGYGISECEF